jgi:hypothetical protein
MEPGETPGFLIPGSPAILSFRPSRTEEWRETDMADQEPIGDMAAVAGGIGLGLLLGSEYPGTPATLLGAALALGAIIIIAVSRFRSRKTE